MVSISGWINMQEILFVFPAVREESFPDEDLKAELNSFKPSCFRLRSMIGELMCRVQNWGSGGALKCRIMRCCPELSLSLSV